jgi:hypothetical protein
MICPYRHLNDIKDVFSHICYNKETVVYYVDSIKEKISDEFEKLMKLQAVIEQHKCVLCRNEYGGTYVKFSCGDVLCKPCSDNCLKGDKEKICRLCKKIVYSHKEIIVKK